MSYKTTSCSVMINRLYVLSSIMGNTLTKQPVQVVALENNVEGINKKNLKRPTRASLAPATGRKSYSGIVNSPY